MFLYFCIFWAYTTTTLGALKKHNKTYKRKEEKKNIKQIYKYIKHKHKNKNKYNNT